ncbi:MAG TPA: AIR synthase-related protein [Candidatus Paceibacterota bacterium]
MISRIYVAPRSSDIRGGQIDSYLLEHELTPEMLILVGRALANPITENFSINKLPKVKPFSYAIEIGFKPGVTDNVGHTTRETIIDLLHLENGENLSVYSSKIFLISKSIKMEAVKKLALSLYNPLIETAYITTLEAIRKENNFPLKIPQVILEKRTSIVNVPLAVSDEELIKIGREGIVDDNGSRRGPLALDLDSMNAIAEYFVKLRRDPTDIELESLAQTWSEHCKHTIFANPIDNIKDGLYKTYIKGATNLIRKKLGRKDFCVSVFKDNSGAIGFDEEFLITHKVETHNSPSALDPYGGAITGIVGVNRDCLGFGLGAKPVANTYGFCFGEPEDTRPLFRDKNMTQKMFPPKRIMEGVIKGINTGGNCSGIPTISGFVRYDDRYRGKPLVFAGTVGLIPRTINNLPSHEKSAKAGDYIVVVGGRVGADGIHGATFSSVVMDSSSPATAVQIGDPITQKKFSDAIVKEARGMNLYNSITDNGAGGISCSVAEMAKECDGATVNLEKVPLKYPGLRPWEIWISESQERMTLAVPPKKWPVFSALMQSRGVEATVIGEFNNSGKCVVKWESKVIMDLELEFLHNGLPQKQLTTTPHQNKFSEPKLPSGFSRTKVFEELLGNNNISSFSFISEQYDHEVQASSVLKPLSGRGMINTEAQVFKPVLSSNKGVVLASGLCPSYSDISTYSMAAAALDTAVRNTVAAGGTLGELAILDNFCWCSSYDKTRLAELVDALKACYDGALAYSTPFISGKDSMFNDFQGYDEKGKPVKISIPPTLLISAISVMPDIYKTVSPEFKNAGDVIYLLGETNDELGASEYYKLLAKHEKNNAIGNKVPQVNFKKNLKTYLALEEVIEKELLVSSLSVSSGGLSVALAKSSVGGMLGCNISLENLSGTLYGGDSSVDSVVDAKLFSESQGRILVSVSPKNILRFKKTMRGIPYTELGKVSKDGKVVVMDGKNKVVESAVKKLRDIYHAMSQRMK